MIDRCLRARRSYAFGEQVDHFDDPHIIGWTRSGTEEQPGGLAVLLSNAGDAAKWMQVGAPNSAYVDVTGHVADVIRQPRARGPGEGRATTAQPTQAPTSAAVPPSEPPGWIQSTRAVGRGRPAARGDRDRSWTDRRDVRSHDQRRW